MLFAKKPSWGLKPTFKFALAYVALSLILPGLVYVTAQQLLRQSANDPQLQIVQDSWGQLMSGKKTPPQLVGSTTLDLALNPLGPFLIMFTDDRRVVASGAQYKGQTLAPPVGSFEAAKATGLNTFTWEPLPGQRYAAVLQYAGPGKGYLLSARSLYYTEEREQQMWFFAAAASATLLVIGFVILAIRTKE